LLEFTVLPPKVTVTGGLKRGADEVAGALKIGAAFLGTLKTGTSDLTYFLLSYSYAPSNSFNFSIIVMKNPLVF
jgi:hypothetical protein